MIGIVGCSRAVMLPRMRIDIEIETDAYNASVEAYLDSTVRPALAAGLTAAAEAVRDDATLDLLAELDDPNPFTQRAIAVLPAKAPPGRSPTPSCSSWIARPNTSSCRSMVASVDNYPAVCIRLCRHAWGRFRWRGKDEGQPWKS